MEIIFFLVGQCRHVIRHDATEPIHSFLHFVLTREYAKRNEQVIGDDRQFTHSLTHSLDPSRRCQLYPNNYVKIIKFDPIIMQSFFFFELEIRFFFCLHLLKVVTFNF